jgi:hypothetical protein
MKKKLEAVAFALAEHAINQLNSGDNVSVMIVRVVIGDPDVPIPRNLGYNEAPSQYQAQRASKTGQGFQNNPDGFRKPYDENSPSNSYNMDSLRGVSPIEDSLSKHVVASSGKLGDNDSNSYGAVSGSESNHGNKKAGGPDEDDMMDFLLDDSNF